MWRSVSCFDWEGTTGPEASLGQDAVLAVDSGVDGILISNHGGMKSSLSLPGNPFTSISSGRQLE